MFDAYQRYHTDVRSQLSRSDCFLRHFGSGTGKSQKRTEIRGPDKSTRTQQAIKSRLLISVCLGACICV